MKKLRTELAKAKAETEEAKKAAAQPAPASSDELKQLRTAYAAPRPKSKSKRNNWRARKSTARNAPRWARQLADLERMNATLKQETIAAEKKAAGKPPADTKAIQAELAKAKADLESARKTNQAQVADLERQNKALAADLAAAKKTTGMPGVESEELAKLRQELAAAKAEAEKAKQSSSRLSDLERENKRLALQLADARKLADADKVITGVTPGQNFGPARAAAPVNPEITKLQQQNDDLKQLLAATQKKADAKVASATAEAKKAREEVAGTAAPRRKPATKPPKPNRPPRKRMKLPRTIKPSKAN